MEEQDIKIVVMSNGKRFNINNIKAYNSSAAIELLKIAEDQVKITAKKWGLELAPVWDRKMAEYVTVGELCERIKGNIKLLRIIVI